MTSALTDLLSVQDLDLALDRVRHRRAHLPEREELAGLATTEAGLTGERQQLSAEREALAERQAVAEAELESTERRAAVIDQRLYGGQVAAARDLQAMTAEVDQLKSRASHLEDVVLEVMDAAEPLDARMAEIGLRLDELSKRRRQLEGQLASSEAAIDAETAELGRSRTEAAAAVPGDLLATYERLRSRLGGIGVARLVGNHCDGCHLTLSAVELDRVRHLRAGEVYTCDQCSRILVP
ncbi:MAG: C4-type zinc ribbon domain-containing protein [Actinomycetota bacterium]|nr:C4-type zinc ribbon domain-containing protein [Actinomycetota bacterium]